MKIVMGADRREAGSDLSPVESMVRRLRFSNAEIDVVHVVPPPVYPDWGVEAGLSQDTYNALMQVRRDEAVALIEHVAARLVSRCDAGEKVNVAVLEGLVAERIMEYADTTAADLIAVDSAQHSGLHSLLTGSVARALTIGAHHSLLIGREDWRRSSAGVKDPAQEWTPAMLAESSRPVRAVFATDHSPYAHRCLEALLRVAPQGLSHLTVMTAFPKDELRVMGAALPGLTIDPATAVRRALVTRNETAVDTLTGAFGPLGCAVEGRVVGLPVNGAIERTMEETQADLLILGARGHGFVERVTLGSVSFKHVMASPYSVLVLRA